MESADRLNQLTEAIIQAAIKVHWVLGPESIERFEAVRRAQMLTYLRLTGCRVGLILNFNKETLVAGVKRVVNGFPERKPSAVGSATRSS